MKESITKFDLESAFKALNELNTPVAEKGIKANKPALNEIFSRKSKFDSLFEEYYDIGNTEELSDAKEAREAEIAKAKLARIEKIVDLDADSPEDLLTSYVGKYIIQCPQCMTLFYKNPEDVVESEDDPSTVNVEEICQHCGNDAGYTLIGKVGEATPEEAAEEFGIEVEEEIPEDETTEETSEETGDEENFDLDTDLEEIDFEIEDDEAEDANKKEESTAFEHNGESLVEELQEDADLDVSATEFEELINSPEFKKPISDSAARAMLNTEDDLEEGIIVNNENLEYAVLNADGTFAGAPCTTEEEANELAAQAEGRVIVKIEGLKKKISENTSTVDEFNLIFEPANDFKDEDLTNTLCDVVGKVGIKWHSAKKLNGKYYIAILGSEEDLHTAKLAIENSGFFSNWVEELVSSYNHETSSETLTEGIFDKFKEKVVDSLNKVIGALKTREQKANWILNNALNDFDKAELDPEGKVKSNEENKRFSKFIVVGYKDRYTNDKEIKAAPSYNNKDLVIGMEKPMEVEDYLSADKIAKGWSLRQGNGPAYIYLAKSLEDKNAVFVCEYFKGELANDQVDKYFEIVQKDIKGSKLIKDIKPEKTEVPVQDTGAEDKVNTDGETNSDEISTNDDTPDVEIQYREISAAKAKPGMIVADDSYSIKDGKELTLHGTIVKCGNRSSRRIITFDLDTGETVSFAFRPDDKITIKEELPVKTKDDAEPGKEIEDVEAEAAAAQESLNSIMNNLEELHESSLENLISDSLIESYKNVAGFRLSNCEYLDESLKINGTIYFTSGAQRKTTYTFTEAFVEESNKIKMHGLNEKLGLDKVFILSGTANKTNKTFITESFSYTNK
jgi:hypothetical protein